MQPWETTYEKHERLNREAAAELKKIEDKEAARAKNKVERTRSSYVLVLR